MSRRCVNQKFLIHHNDKKVIAILKKLGWLNLPRRCPHCSTKLTSCRLRGNTTFQSRCPSRIVISEYHWGNRKRMPPPRLTTPETQFSVLRKSREVESLCCLLASMITIVLHINKDMFSAPKLYHSVTCCPVTGPRATNYRAHNQIWRMKVLDE